MAKNEGMEKHEEFKAEFKKRVKEQAKMLYRKSLDEISDRHKFVCVAYAVKDIVIDQWIATQKAYDEKDAKIVYYLSMEFLMGRALGNMIINLSSRDEIKEAIEELGLDLNVIEDQEPDAALGNGGLGRLAACFLDSLSTLNYPAYGCGIRYKYGMFQQKIENGYQKEIPEDWLRHANPLEIKREEYACEVKFGGYVRVENRDGRNYFIQEGYQSVNAIPYDMPIVGYGNNVVNTLRIWDAEPVVHFNLDEFDKGSYMAAVEQENLAKTITEVLYPNDNHYAGKELRLKQQYFFVSASLQTAIKKYLKNHDDIRKLPEKVVFQMNDTHPTLTVAELMRLLMDEYNLEWDEAWNITTHACAYTNHTIMSEALEKWPIELFSRLLPRCYQIIEEINRARNEEHKKQAEREMVRQQERTRVNAEKKASANKKSVARPKRISGKRMIFFAFQGNTFDKEFNGGYIWAPISNKAGNKFHHWEKLLDVRAGDIILHGCDGYIKAISVAKTSCFDCVQPEELVVEDLWDREGRKVECDYVKIEKPIKTSDFKDDIIRFCQVKYSPFDKDGNGNMGYLFDINRELAKIFIRATVNKNNYLNSIDYINDFLNEE